MFSDSFRIGEGLDYGPDGKRTIITSGPKVNSGNSVSGGNAIDYGRDGRLRLPDNIGEGSGAGNPDPTTVKKQSN